MNAAHGLSLFSSGPLDRLERGLGILRGGPRDILRHSATMLAIGWGPIIVLALFGMSVQQLDLAHHVRWWIAVPALFVGEARIDVRIRRGLDHLVQGRIVSDAEALARSERYVVALSDSWLIEAILLLIAICWSAPPLFHPLPAAEVWQHAVSLPLFRFLVLRCAWRWLLWTYLLFRVSCLDLDLIGTHPDRCGGLSVLSQASRTLGIVAFALSSIGAARWSSEIASGLVTFGEIQNPVATFVFLVLAVATCPVVFFFPLLRRARDAYVLEFGLFADRYVRLFHRKWIDDPGRDPLGAGDIQSLADLGSSFEIVDTMRLLPIRMQEIVFVVIASLLPLVPLFLVSVPMGELLQKVVDSVL